MKTDVKKKQSDQVQSDQVQMVVTRTPTYHSPVLFWQLSQEIYPYFGNIQNALECFVIFGPTGMFKSNQNTMYKLCTLVSRKDLYMYNTFIVTKGLAICWHPK